MLTPEQVLEGLTDPQRAAATHLDGPLLVLAGAGSGKTRTITRRIAYMAACGIPAWNILAITFTNKAAGEMRERVTQLLGSAGGAGGGGGGRPGRGPMVCTFHSLCARLLREFAAAAKLPRAFSIFDSSDQSKTVKQAIKDVHLSTENFQPAAVLSAISDAKNKLQLPPAFASAAGSFFEKNVARVYARYEQLLAESKAVDFDDLLLKVAILLRDNRDVRTQLQDRFQYILIDEYQDTNHAQFMLAHMLAMEHKNLCATGDPDQSIYGWRGANIRNILEFEQFYPNAKVVLLEQNYRSTKTILKAASGLIANNTQRKKKDLWTENEQGSTIQVLRCNDEHHEAAEIVRRLKEQHDKPAPHGIGWDKMAIFYRVNSLSRVLEDALMKQGIPYQIARGTEFYARKEIKDVLAYLRVIANPDDNVSLERIVNVPTRGLGDTSLLKIQDHASRQRISLLAACAAADEIPDLSTRAKTSAKKVAALFAAWRELAAHGEAPTNLAPPDSLAWQRKAEDASVAETPDVPQNHDAPVETDPLFDPALAASTANAPIPIQRLMERVVKESGLEDDMRKHDSGEDEGTGRLANVAELISVAAEFDLQNPEGTLGDYLEQVTLVSDVDRLKAEGGGAVTLMTLHAAKGLEFPFVAMVGMEDGLVPHARAIEYGARPDEMEEERRLAFVGITRAMKQLVMSHARYRMIRGETQRTIASQFLQEIPEECLEEIDLTSEEPGVGSVGYSDESSYGFRAGRDRRQREAVAERRMADAVAGEFQRGILVRHPQFGLGRIEEILPAGTMTKATVRFQGAGKKTLILQYARLEKVDP